MDDKPVDFKADYNKIYWESIYSILVYVKRINGIMDGESGRAPGEQDMESSK